jgi:hypothetical protein
MEDPLEVLILPEDARVCETPVLVERSKEEEENIFEKKMKDYTS